MGAEQCLDAWLMWGSSLRQCFLRLSSCLILSFLLLSLLPPPPPPPPPPLDRPGVTCLSRRSRSWCPDVPSAQVQFSLGAECSGPACSLPSVHAHAPLGVWW